MQDIQKIKDLINDSKTIKDVDSVLYMLDTEINALIDENKFDKKVQDELVSFYMYFNDYAKSNPSIDYNKLKNNHSLLMGKMLREVDLFDRNSKLLNRISKDATIALAALSDYIILNFNDIRLRFNDNNEAYDIMLNDFGFSDDGRDSALIGVMTLLFLEGGILIVSDESKLCGLLFDKSARISTLNANYLSRMAKWERKYKFVELLIPHIVNDYINVPQA